MHEETAEPIQNAAQVIEGAAQVDVGNVDMPVLVQLQRLLETGPLARWFCSSTGIINPACFNTRRTNRHNVSVEHHERQPPITLQRVLQMELNDRFLLPRLQATFVTTDDHESESLTKIVAS
jgi:hypothetical protein